jgi:NOL1/NOP2/sun family putative RNA methylase
VSRGGRRKGKPKSSRRGGSRARRPDPDAPLAVARYRELIPDADRFLEVVRTPEPKTLRTNVLRTTPDELRSRLVAKGYAVEPVEHQPEFFRVERPRDADGKATLPPVSDTLEHWAGHFYIQQTVTGLATPLLDPQPGERVLDLCSAPGGKTTHIAERMGGDGIVVAAEVNENRIRALLGNSYRLGHPNLLVIAADGREFPTEATFDRVMVDVPCSAEGTLRKKGGAIPHKNTRARRKLFETQAALLRRAIEVTRPGGTLLYVTCTFDPVENEAVLTEVLKDAPVEVEEVTLPVPHAPGVTSWEGATYDPRMERAIRMYPHLHDSGGLFLCKLRKEGEGPVTGWRPTPDVFPEEERYPDEEFPAPLAALEAITDHYGFDRDVLARLLFMRRGTNVWAHRVPEWPVEAWSPGRWRTVSVGFRGLDLGGNGPPRPSNDLLQVLDDAVAGRRVEFSPSRWLDLLEGRRVEIEGIADGYVALVLGGEVVGRGFVRDGVLRHEIPRGRTRWMRAAVELEASTRSD